MPNEDPCAFATDTQKKTTLHQKCKLLAGWRVTKSQDII